MIPRSASSTWPPRAGRWGFDPVLQAQNAACKLFGQKWLKEHMMYYSNGSTLEDRVCHFDRAAKVAWEPKIR
jgi:hypothetical protein